MRKKHPKDQIIQEWGLYNTYPYKKVPFPSARPYVAVRDQVPDHKFSMTYKQWSKVICTFYKYLVLYLLTGRAYRFTSNLGELQLVKYKKKKSFRPNFKKMLNYYKEKTGLTNVKEVQQYIKSVPRNELYKPRDNKHIQGYKVVLSWTKQRNYEIKFGSYWGGCMTKQGIKYIYDILRSDPVIINNIVESHPMHYNKMLKKINKYELYSRRKRL